jgi:hypothetical protein
MHAEFWKKKTEEITRRLCHKWLGTINIKTEFEGTMAEGVIRIFR